MSEGKQTTILNVDDNDVSRTASSMILRGRGYEVLEARTGQEALDMSQQDPDLVLLDIQLPDIDGFEVCRRLREAPATATIPVLHLTASAPGDESRIRGLEGGAEGYLTQPVNPAVLLAYVDALLRTRRAERQREEAYAELKQVHDDHRAVLDQLQLGIITLGADQEIIYFNGAANRLFGLRRRKASGLPLTGALPMDSTQLAKLEGLCQQPEAARAPMELMAEDPDGARRWLRVEVQDDPRKRGQRLLLFTDRSEVHDLQGELNRRSRFHDLIGKSDAMQEVFKRLKAVAGVDWTVLIEGATGTGKELVARAIHAQSPRSEQPFVAVNCAGLSDSLLESQLFGHRRGAFTGAVKDQAGLFEAADGGTLFLDEIGDISPNMQKTLLRALEAKEITRVGDTNPRKVDVRVITATHQDLTGAVDRGEFRRDLLYRIRIGRLTLPPLPSRRSDIPLLVAEFIKKSRAATGKLDVEMGSEAMAVLLQYSWPGNVRELKAAVDYSTLHCLGTMIMPEDLPPEIQDEAQAGPPPTLDPVSEPGQNGQLQAPSLLRRQPLDPEQERAMLLEAMRRTGGNRTAAAKLLGMSRATFYRRVSELDIRLD